MLHVIPSVFFPLKIRISIVSADDPITLAKNFFRANGGDASGVIVIDDEFHVMSNDQRVFMTELNATKQASSMRMR